jgi:nucleoside-diphosphate-sugar epimerase
MSSPRAPRRRLLLTGASGFVGSHVLRRLVASDADVVAVHNRALDPSLQREFADRVRWIRADLTADVPAGLVRDVHAVLHLAGYASMSEEAAEVERMERLNVAATRRLAVSSKEAGVRQFVYVSSIAACEVGAGPVIDEESGAPRTAYGRSKRTAESEALALADSEFAVTVLRPTALFGEHHLGSVFELVRTIDRGRFFLIGDGSNRTNFYYVQDFVAALLAAVDNPAAYGQTFIACDEPRTLRTLVQDIQVALGANRAVLRLPLSFGLAAGAVCDVLSKVTGKALPLSSTRVRAMTRDCAYVSDKLRRVLGVLPQVGIAEGLRRSIEWYRAAGLL